MNGNGAYLLRTCLHSQEYILPNTRNYIESFNRRLRDECLNETTPLLQSLETWKATLPIGEIFLVADRAMMLEKNLQALEKAEIKYVVAAKLKKYPKDLRTKILENKGTQIESNKREAL